MRLIKILILLAVLFTAGKSSAQFVQPMGFTDYSFWDQMNIGNRGAKLTNPSAFLELGNATNSKKGLLFPRGNKDSVLNPVKGLVIFDLPTNQLVYFNGSIWKPVGGSVIGGSGGGAGLREMNGDTSYVQSFTTGVAGNDFGISTAGGVHTFNLPTVSATARGLATSAMFNTWNTVTGKLNIGDTAAMLAHTRSLHPLLGGSYNNPSWLNSLDAGKITNIPAAWTNNIYNADGILSTNRTITGNGKNLYIPNIGYFLVEGSTTGSMEVNPGGGYFQFNDGTTSVNMEARGDGTDPYTQHSVTRNGYYAGIETAKDGLIELMSARNSWNIFNVIKIKPDSLVFGNSKNGGVGYSYIDWKIRNLPSSNSATDYMMVYDTLLRGVGYRPIPTGQNFANTNLTFSANRTHTLAGYDLNLSYDGNNYNKHTSYSFETRRRNTFIAAHQAETFQLVTESSGASTTISSNAFNWGVSSIKVQARGSAGYDSVSYVQLEATRHANNSLVIQLQDSLHFRYSNSADPSKRLDWRIRNLPSSNSSSNTMMVYDTILRKVAFMPIPAGGSGLTPEQEAQLAYAYSQAFKGFTIQNGTGGQSLFSTLNDTTGKIKNVNLVAGSNITLTPNHTGDKVEWTIASTGGGGGSSSLTQHQIGVGNASNELSGSANLQFDGTYLKIKNSLATNGAEGWHYTFNDDYYMGNAVPGKTHIVSNTNVVGLTVNSTGSLTAPYYNTARSGTAAYSLAVDASGNVITTALGGGSGETNTMSSVGGGIDLFNTKSGVDFPMRSLASNHFELSTDIITLSTTVTDDIALGKLAHSWGNHASVGYLTNITGKISEGTNITITGSGTTASPYVINAAGGGFTPSGTGSQYIKGDGTYATFPTAVSSFTNDANYITQAGARTAISLTTTGSSGAATYNNATGELNIPNYSGGITSMTAIGASPNADGATISGSTLTLQPASASFGGVITSGTQTIAGNKTLNGSLTLSNTNGITMSSSVQSITQSVGGVGFDAMRYDLGGSRIVYQDFANIPSSQTRTFAYPSVSGTIVLNDNAATLTNKTINGTNNTITNVSLSTGVTGTLPVANIGTGTKDNTTYYGGDGVFHSALKNPTVNFQSPTTSEDMVIFYTDVAITITKVAEATKGTSPSTTYNIVYSSDRSASGTNVFSSDRTVTSTTGTTTTTFANASIPAGSYVRIKTSATSGTVDDLGITITYRQ